MSNRSVLPPRFTWRVVDIVVASVIGVASSVVFLVWNVGYEGPYALVSPLLPGLGGLVNGPWFIAATLAGLIIRKPGAAIYAEMLAATISALVGNKWGAGVLLSGFVQGLGVEIVLALFAFKLFGPVVATLAGAAAGLACGLLDIVVAYPMNEAFFKVIYVASSTVSGAVIAGLGAWLIVRALAATGALSRFQAGRDVAQRV